ncbi:MAG: response regulator [Luteolibacter sp.]
MPKINKLILIEDHEGYREVIVRTLERVENIELIGQYGTAEIALRDLQNQAVINSPDIILLDLNLPGISGIEAIPWIRKYSPEAKIIILTQSNAESDVLTAISLGASGYLLKSARTTEIIKSIEVVANGGASLDPNVAMLVMAKLKNRKASAQEPDISLSNREHEILSLLGDGLAKKEIAKHLDIGVTTVAYHIKNIYEKLEVPNAPAAVSKGHKRGLL